MAEVSGAEQAADREVLLRSVTEATLGYLEALAALPVIPSRPAPDRCLLPEASGSAVEALAEFVRAWLPAMAASAGPRYLGYVVGGSTPAALAGDWLASALDQNVASGEGAAVELERQVIDWIRQLLGLGTELEGLMVTGASMANTTCLAVAREWAGRSCGLYVNRDGMGQLGGVRVLSGTAHSCIPKALSLLGIGRGALRAVETVPGREAVDVGGLRRTLLEEQTGPTVVVANAGTVNTTDFDDLDALLELRAEYPFWLHVDAAFGAFAALDERVSHLVARLGEADSVAVDLHKWLNVPYDSAVAFTRRPDLQVDTFHNAATYLGAPGTTPDPLHLGPENSRRQRALPAWMALRTYGRGGHAAIVRRCNDHARHFGEEVSRLPGVELVAPVRLNVVCFTVPGPVSEFLRSLTATGEVFMTSTRCFGVDAVRAAFSNWSTTTADVVRAVRAVESCLDA